MTSLEKWSEEKSSARNLDDVQNTQARSGRFQSKWKFHDVLDGMRDVALATCESQTRALAMSQSEWDLGAASHGPASLPKAESIRQRIGLEWKATLQLAFLPVPDRAAFVGSKKSGAGARFNDVPERRLLAPLKAMARRRGATPSFLEYDVAMVELERDQHRRGLTLSPRPRAAALLGRFGSWSQTVEAAGLEPPSVQVHRVDDQLIVRLNTLTEHFEIIPTSKYFRAWCRANGVSYGSCGGQRWPQVLEELRSYRASIGLDPDVRLAKRGEIPLISAPRSTRRRRTARAEVLASLRCFARLHLQPGETPTSSKYYAAARRDASLLSRSQVSRHGKWQDLCREAGIA